MTTQKDIQRMIAFAEDKGIEKGKETAMNQMAKAMKEKGYPVTEISEITSLDEKAIQAL